MALVSQFSRDVAPLAKQLVGTLVTLVGILLKLGMKLVDVGRQLFNERTADMREAAAEKKQRALRAAAAKARATADALRTAPPGDDGSSEARRRRSRPGARVFHDGVSRNDSLSSVYRGAARARAAGPTRHRSPSIVRRPAGQRRGQCRTATCGPRGLCSSSTGGVDRYASTGCRRRRDARRRHGAPSSRRCPG